MNQLSIHERKQIEREEGNCPEYCDLCLQERRQLVDDKRKAAREGAIDDNQ